MCEWGELEWFLTSPLQSAASLFIINLSSPLQNSLSPLWSSIPALCLRTHHTYFLLAPHRCHCIPPAHVSWRVCGMRGLIRWTCLSSGGTRDGTLTHDCYLRTQTRPRSAMIRAEILLSPTPWRPWHRGLGTVPRSLRLVCVCVTVQIPISSYNGCIIGHSGPVCGWKWGRLPARNIQPCFPLRVCDCLSLALPRGRERSSSSSSSPPPCFNSNFLS